VSANPDRSTVAFLWRTSYHPTLDRLHREGRLSTECPPDFLVSRACDLLERAYGCGPYPNVAFIHALELAGVELEKEGAL
jgi:hypothetical protein